VVTCQYDRARRVINMKENLAKEELYLHQVFTTNGYSDGIIKAGSNISPKDKQDITVDNQQVKHPVLSGMQRVQHHDCFQIWEDSEIATFQSERQITYRHEFFSTIQYPLQLWQSIY